MKDDQSNVHVLNLKKANRSYGLMKAPLAVAKAWEKQDLASSSSSSSESLPTANIVLSIDLLQPRLLSEFTMELSGAEFGNIPKKYSMEKSNDIPPMGVFSDTNQGKVAVEGIVTYKMFMKPHGQYVGSYNKDIGQQKKTTSKDLGKIRQTKSIHNDYGERLRPMPGIGLASARIEKGTKPVLVKQPEDKRTRGDRSEIETKMFKLFEDQPNWTLKRLVQETNQPAMFIKEILHDMCVYINRGLNIGTYELKPEYKRFDEENKSGQ